MKFRENKIGIFSMLGEQIKFKNSIPVLPLVFAPNRSIPNFNSIPQEKIRVCPTVLMTFIADELKIILLKKQFTKGLDFFKNGFYYFNFHCTNVNQPKFLKTSVV